MTAMPRAAQGFLAGALSVLIVHQAIWALLHWAGMMPPAYPMRAVGPLHVPLVLDLAFWGGVWGLVFGLALPHLPAAPAWLLGLGLGACAILVAWFVVAPLHGAPIGNGFTGRGMFISLAINLPWGIGAALIGTVLMGRAYPRARRSPRKLA